MAHDLAGNMTKLSKPGNWSDHYCTVYDAWNRLVEVRASDNSTLVAQYQYDGRNFRTVKKTYAGGSLSETRHFYYNGSWQVLEERLESGGTIASTAYSQNVWGMRYIDDLIFRERDTTGSGVLDEHYYALQDANWNVVALAAADGSVAERFTYTAYGSPTFLDMSFIVRSPNASSYSWDALYTGRQYDPETGLYHYRNRPYGAELGRFSSRDPIGYKGKDFNLYRYVFNSPLTHTDPTGEDTAGCDLPDWLGGSWMNDPNNKTPRAALLPSTLATSTILKSDCTTIAIGPTAQSWEDFQAGIQYLMMLAT